MLLWPPVLVLLLASGIPCVHSMTPGLSANLDQGHSFLHFREALYKDTRLSVSLLCTTKLSNLTINVQWTLAQLKCWSQADPQSDYKQIVELSTSQEAVLDNRWNRSETQIVALQSEGWTEQKKYECKSDRRIVIQHLHDLPHQTVRVLDNSSILLSAVNTTAGVYPERKTILTETWVTGVYVFIFNIWPEGIRSSASKDPGAHSDFQATVQVNLHNADGYLSPLEWPKLPASGALAFIYLLMCTIWTYLWMKAQLFTDKIHVIIGSVTLAGAIIQTITFVQKTSQNNNGYALSGIDLSFEFLSLVQSVLVIALLMVVSYGYGLTRFTLEKKFKVLLGTLCVMLLVFGLFVLILNQCDLEAEIVKTLLFIGRILYFVTFIVSILAIFITGLFTFCHLHTRKHNDKGRIFGVMMATVLLQFIVEVVIFAVFWLNLSTIFFGCSELWHYQWVAPFSVDLQLCVLMTLLMVLWRPADVAQSYAFFPISNDEKEEEEDDDNDELADEEKGLDTL